MESSIPYCTKFKLCLGNARKRKRTNCSVMNNQNRTGDADLSRYPFVVQIRPLAILSTMDRKTTTPPNMNHIFNVLLRSQGGGVTNMGCDRRSAPEMNSWIWRIARCPLPADSDSFDPLQLNHVRAHASISETAGFCNSDPYQR